MLQIELGLDSQPGRRRPAARSLLAPVTVCAQHALIGEAVRAALAGAGLTARRLPWERLLEAVEDGGVDTPMLLLCELGPAPERRAAVAAVRSSGGPCIVLTDADPGPAWGAVLEAGAVSVLSSAVDVESVVAEVSAVLHGDRPFDEDRRRELVASWVAYRDEQRARQARVDALSPRERSVLELMHQGRSVSAIANEAGVAESTVRSQVRRLFAKLEVHSQLAAVAVYAGYVVDTGD